MTDLLQWEHPQTLAGIEVGYKKVVVVVVVVVSSQLA